MMVISGKLTRGFSLVEMVVVIVITGILGGMVAVFIRAPVQGYVDSARHAEMTDIADTALRRIGRDLRTAVPNSVRMPNTAGSSYIEFLPTSAGGSYRADPAGAGNLCGGSALGDALSFDAVDTCFEILGVPGTAITFGAGDAIVIGSTQSDGNPPYLAVNSPTGVRRTIAAAGVGTQPIVQITSTVPFPAAAELPGHRFAVVPAAQQAVTYSCETVGVDAAGNGTGTLVRYWAYGFDPIQSVPPIAAGNNAILATNVSACNFVYNISNQRNSLVTMTLTITRGNESVRLYHEVHINNAP
jgi:MSHA biogenesis protein MshO